MREKAPRKQGNKRTRTDGYEQHKNILLDAIDYVFPEATQLVKTNAPERVEVILQEYTRNVPANVNRKTTDGQILHLVNLTGFSGNTYFEPLPVYGLTFRVKSAFKPSKIFSMVTEKPLPFTWKDGFVEFKVGKLGAFEGVVMDR